MSRYYHLKVKEVIRETSDAVTIHFWHPWNEVIQYKPGQYLTVLRTSPEGAALRRSYSLSSSPYTDISPAITVKRIDGGEVSNYLVSDLKEGDVLEVMQPAGTFCLEPDSEASRTFFLLGTGSGITPLLSIAKSVLIVEPESTVILVYGNRTIDDVIFKDQIEKLENKYGSRFRVIHSLTRPPGNWTGSAGRLTQDKLRDLLQPYADPIVKDTSLFFLCGQDEFMEGAKQVLENFGAPENAIRSESFFTGHETAGHEQNDLLPEPGPGAPRSRTIRLHYEGEEHHLTVGAHQSVLEAALENDIDLPYSCQAGMCTACLGRVLQGKVTLDEYDALTDAEVQEGFILTCVAHPQSDDVVIEVE